MDETTAIALTLGLVAFTAGLVRLLRRALRIARYGPEENQAIEAQEEMAALPRFFSTLPK